MFPPSKFWAKLHNPLLIVGILITVTTLLKIYKLDGGFVPGEPDERNYVDVVRNLRNSPLPNFDGITFFHSPPLFHYLAYIASFFLPVKYLAVRVISLLASFILAWVLFIYLRHKVSLWAAVFGATAFTLLPMSVYYSRLGLLEMLLALNAFVFMAFFDLAWVKGSFRFAFISGLGLGLGLLTKYSILPLLVVPIVIFSLWLVVNLWKQKSWRFLTGSQVRQKVYILIIIYGLGLAIFLPVTYFNYTLDPHEFKSQIKQDIALGGKSFDLGVVSAYQLAFPGFLSWVGVWFLLLGFAAIFKSGFKYLAIILSSGLLLFVLLKVAIFQPRYLVISLPFLAVLMGVGYEFFLNVASGLIKNLKYNKLWKPAFLVVSLTLFLPTSYQALLAGYHNTIEEVGNYIKAENSRGLWVTSNFWPSAFVDEVGYKTTWYSSDKIDSGSLSGGGRTKYQPIDQPTYELTIREGGWVVVEDLYTAGFSGKMERKNVVSILRSGHQPLKIFTDPNPNWPFYKEASNSFSVYYLPPR